MTNKICDGCETVAHCMKNGCVPKTTKQTQVRSTEEALKLALGYMDGSLVTDHLTGYERKRHVMDAIFEALTSGVLAEESSGTAQPAQPQQEPVGEAYLCDKCQTPFDGAYYCPECGHNTATKESVYTSPPAQRKPLTDEQFLELLLRTGTQELVGVATFVGGSIQMQGKIGLLRSAKIIKEFVEAAHGIKEKNT